MPIEGDEERATEVGVWSAVAGPPEGALVVLVHGSMDRSAGMLRLSRRLDQRFRVVRYDRRGYGRSASLGPPYDVAAHVDDLVRILADHRVGPAGAAATLVGHSFGGNVALAVAEQRPELVRAVVVYETPLSWLEWWPGGSAGGRALEHHDAGDAAEAFMRRLVGDATWERLPASTRAARRAEGPAMLAELTDLRRRRPWTWSGVPHPVLALYGEHARPHHVRAMTTLATRLPRAEAARLPGAGHGGPYTHSAALAERIIRFHEALGGATVDPTTRSR